MTDLEFELCSLLTVKQWIVVERVSLKNKLCEVKE
jgi:hypothetical protein